LVALLALACGGGGGGDGIEAGDEIRVERSALDALDAYAFMTQAEVSSPDGELSVTFDAKFQAPDRLHGTAAFSGDVEELPGEIEVVQIGETMWVRQEGEDWVQLRQDETAIFFLPLLTLTSAGSPSFYLNALEFGSLRLVAARPAEDVNGVSAVPVRLDKAALIDLLGQGIIRGAEGEPNTDIQENAQGALPEDIVVETWIAEEGGYPARIVIDLSTKESDEGFLLWRSPVSIHLQMDITDTDIAVNIQPPVRDVYEVLADSLPVYPGATVVGRKKITDGGFDVTLAVPDDPDLVVAFYQRQFTQAGWEQGIEGNPLEGYGGTFKKENATVELFYRPRGELPPEVAGIYPPPGYFVLSIHLFGPGAPEFGPVTPPPSP
jgi:hypothetical protein